MSAMVEPAVTLDAAMSAHEVLERLALQGHWLDPMHPAAQTRIDTLALRLGLTFDEAARRLAHTPARLHVAVRRQWGDRVLWYALSLAWVLKECMAAPPEQPLLDVLNLHETDSGPPVDVADIDQRPTPHGVVLDRGEPVGVLLPTQRMQQQQSAPPEPPNVFAEPPPHPTSPATNTDFGSATGPRTGSAPSRNGDDVDVMHARTNLGRKNDEKRKANGGGLLDKLKNAWRGPARAGHMPPSRDTAREAPREAAPEAPPTPVEAWPRIDAPPFVAAQTLFEVVVGFAHEQQAGVVGGAVLLPRTKPHEVINLTVELIASGLDAPKGWSRRMQVPLDDLASAQVTFQLIGRPPVAPLPMTLTTLEVRYVLDGNVCGLATRPLVITATAAAPEALPVGQAWATQPATQSAVTVLPDAQAPDLTIEIFKPDRNFTNGHFVCKLYSPHTLAADTGPHEIDLGQDASSFAKGLVDDVRLYSRNALIKNTLEANGKAVAERLPAAVFEALAEVAAKVAPAVPAVLIVSAEPYVPWELAWLDTPIDPTRPAFLGAQALVGRWLREGGCAPRPGAAAAAPPLRPQLQPLSQMKVQNMAVIAGLYKAASGLRKLPQAEAEAQALTLAYAAQALAASPQAINQLLDALPAPGVEAVHFAGHGDFDPNLPDSSVLFLDDGSPLKSKLFRSAKYGGEKQPLLFLNACMIGVGGELLGDMGGFPGNCLRGGFGGLLGALWEVDDAVAHAVALEFWQRALPPAPAKPEPVAAILRDLRAKYAPVATPGALPVPTYLAYVFYGHPRLTLTRTA